MDKLRFIIIGLLSTTLIALELVWTRIFSAEFFYTFAFLTLSLALLGLGVGALTLHLFSGLNKEKYLSVFLSLCGLFALISPPLVFLIELDFTQLFHSWLMVGKFALTTLLLSSSFYFGGMAIAFIFKQNHEDMPRIYMADLLGAAFGVLAAVILMNWIGTPLATFWITLPVLVAAFLTARRWKKIIPVILTAALIALGLFSEQLLEVKRQERAPVIYKYWDALSKIKIFEFNENYRGIQIDNAANSPVYAFDGNWDRPDSLKYRFGIDVSYLISQFDSCTFLSLGAGGGVDVLQALQEGATEIHAVEVNPHINELMLEGELADFSGHIYKDPRVRVVSEDARAYVRRFENKFDVIYSLSSNTFAALASGAFAMAENYLFTTEAFRDYWTSLSDSGFMMMEHQFYMPRLVSECMIALDQLGVEKPEKHFAVYNLPQMRRNILFLSKQPLNDTLRYYAFGPLTPEKHKHIHLLYPPADSLQDNLINQIVLNGWETQATQAKVDISPCNDNRPYTAQMGLWKNFTWGSLEKVLPYEFFGFPLSKLIISIILLVVIVLIIPVNLLPYFKTGEKLKLAPWLYFFAIGMAFMIVEVVLIQKYTLFIGPSVYSFTTILLTLLLASGIGSLFARKFSLNLIFPGIFIWLLFDIFVFPSLTYGLDTLEMFPRIIVTAALIFPLGFLMGMPFPKAALRVGRLVDWGFAVNGAASVLGATAIVLVAFSYGFQIALLCGLLFYGIAYLLISLKSAW